MAKRNSKKSNTSKNTDKEKPNDAQDGGVHSLFDELSEATVLCDHKDYKALADILVLIEKISAWAGENENAFAVDAFAAVTQRIEAIILESAADPAAEFELVSDAISALQQIVCESRGASEAGFPKELLEDQEASESGGFVPAPHVDREIFADFLSRQQSVLEDVESLILAIEKGEDEESLGALKRIVHTIKGEAALLALPDVEKLCHSAEDVITGENPSAATDVLLDAKDWLGAAFAYFAGDGPKPPDVSKMLRKLQQQASFAAREETKTAIVDEFDLDSEKIAEPAEERFIPLEGDLELMGDFVSEATEHLDNADVHLLTIETDPEDAEALNAVFRAFHTIKGVAGFLKLEQIGSLAHESENLLDIARKGEIVLSGAAIDVTFDSLDCLKNLVADLGVALESGMDLRVHPDVDRLTSRIRAVIQGKVVQTPPPKHKSDKLVGESLVASGKLTEEELIRAIQKLQAAEDHEMLGEILVRDIQASSLQIKRALEKQRENPDKKIGEILVEEGILTEEDLDYALIKQEHPKQRPRIGELLVKDKAVPAREVAQALRNQAGAGSAQRSIKVKETVKVDADRLDRLVDLIGELVIAESMVTQNRELTVKLSSEFSRQVRHLDKITRELQEMGTSLRMVPVRPIFQKMARLVRDLARKSGKVIEFTTSGEDTELDKSVVDRIGDPLVHMVRNSIDHGIESDPAEREKRGKPSSGHIELRAFHKGGSIYIEIEDDGQGLNKKRILDKAIERGIIKSDEQLSEKDIYNLIFEAGFSTAKEVTDVSGRGVGMDVVRKNIEHLRGQVEIRSEEGKGSVFTLRLPLTLAIIDGMVVRVGDEQYILPTLSVVRSIRPEAGDLNTVMGKGEMLTVQGELIPLFRLHRLFSVNGSKEDVTSGIVVVVEDDNRQTGIMVDGLIGQQQIVIKSLGESLKKVKGIAGGAIMPDGRVGLILDVGGLVRLANSGEIDYEQILEDFSKESILS